MDNNIDKEHLVEMYNLNLKHSNIPMRYRQSINMIIPEDDKEAYNTLKMIKDNIRDFVKQGKNLLIYSNICGNGKTHWACLIGKKYIWELATHNIYSSNGSVYFLNLNEHLLKRKLAINDPSKSYEIAKEEESAMQCDLLVLDDIGVSKASEYDNAIIYSIINNRINNMKSIIYTSNLSQQMMRENNIDERIIDRIVGTSIKVALKSESMRQGDSYNDTTGNI